MNFGLKAAVVNFSKNHTADLVVQCINNTNPKSYNISIMLAWVYRGKGKNKQRKKQGQGEGAGGARREGAGRGTISTTC